MTREQMIAEISATRQKAYADLRFAQTRYEDWKDACRIHASLIADCDRATHDSTDSELEAVIDRLNGE